MAYRVHHFTREMLREELPLARPPLPAPRAMADFDLPTTDGGRARLQDLVGVRPVLVTLASLTSPLAASSARILRRLYAEFGGEVGFLTVYVRELHPGRRIPQPPTEEWKMRHACAYRRRDAIPWKVAVDDLEGGFHRALGSGSNTVLMDADGRIVFETPFSNDERGLRRALRAVVRGRGRLPRRRRLVPMVRGLARLDDVVRAAGDDALADFRRETPLVYALAELSWIWNALTPLGRAALAGAGSLAIGVLLGGLKLARRRD